jgi:hypothetical protein
VAPYNHQLQPTRLKSASAARDQCRRRAAEPGRYTLLSMLARQRSGLRHA